MSNAMEPDDDASRKRIWNEVNKMRLSREGPVNPDTKDFCGVYAALDMDNTWDFESFTKEFKINITSMSDEVVTFDMKGADPPIANAFRRILLGEVPTVAISRVTVYQNTGVIHDENLAHRLGLVPLVFEPNKLKWKPSDAEFNEGNSIMFTLHAECTGDALSVYSKDLIWKPWSDNQYERFKDDPPRPVVGDILLARLRSGQEIELECFCEVGIGREHAKWSPVSTAFYRLLPDIKLTRPIEGSDAERLKQTCPVGVFDIEDSPNGGTLATVKYPRKCTTCRECIESFPGEEMGLYLGKAKRHYLFTIESSGCIPAPQLFRRAVEVLRDKCEAAKGILQKRAEAGNEVK